MSHEQGLHSQVDTLQSESRRDRITAALLVTKGTPDGRPHAEVLQAELTRREAALVAAKADNERLRENVSEQLRAKRMLREELQVCLPTTFD